jgi:hypothetical protein
MQLAQVKIPMQATIGMMLLQNVLNAQQIVLVAIIQAITVPFALMVSILSQMKAILVFHTTMSAYQYQIQAWLRLLEKYLIGGCSERNDFIF